MNDNPMTAKEYLSQAYRIDQRINAKLEQAERLRELSRRRTVAYGGERVSHSRNVHRMEDTVVRLIEAERTLDREIDAFLDVKQEIRQTIALVADADCRLLLTALSEHEALGRHCGRDADVPHQRLPAAPAGAGHGGNDFANERGVCAP